jgi:pseudouridine-5'-phosphate glycosidase/pseudouridine kinase
MIQLPLPTFFVSGPRALFFGRPHDFGLAVTQWCLGMTNGVLFGAPIPESYTTVGKELQEAVERAVREARENGVDRRGKEVTPWLLERVRELTSGKSLASSECLLSMVASTERLAALRYCAD